MQHIITYSKTVTSQKESNLRKKPDRNRNNLLFPPQPTNILMHRFLKLYSRKKPEVKKKNKHNIAPAAKLGVLFANLPLQKQLVCIMGFSSAMIHLLHTMI